MVCGSTGLAHDHGLLAPSDGPTLSMFRANASPGLGPSRYGGGASRPARLATCAEEGGGADHTGRPCQYDDTCQHAGMADGARGRVTHLGVSPDLQARAGLRVGTEVVK